MTKKFAWSYSALESYETCPRKHYHLKVAKDVVDPPSEAILWGQRVHKALEDRLKEGTPLPPSMVKYEPCAAKIERLKGVPLVETQFAITEDFRPTKWFAKDVWCRGVIDAGVLGQKNALIVDWKTGKRKPNSDQLKLFALLCFAYYPELEKVASSFVWVKSKEMDKEVLTREDVAHVWQTFIPRVQKLQDALENCKWPPKPSGLCRAWCPVKSCEFHGG